VAGMFWNVNAVTSDRHASILILDYPNPRKCVRRAYPGDGRL
jgi:hypothetical protein